MVMSHDIPGFTRAQAQYESDNGEAEEYAIEYQWSIYATVKDTVENRKTILRLGGSDIEVVDENDLGEPLIGFWLGDEDGWCEAGEAEYDSAKRTLKIMGAEINEDSFDERPMDNEPGEREWDE